MVKFPFSPFFSLIDLLDWPLSQIGLVEPREIDSTREGAAYEFSFEVYRTCLFELGVEGEELDAVFGGNASALYGLAGRSE